MLLAQLVDFHFKQHIYGEREALRGRDREKDDWWGGRRRKDRSSSYKRKGVRSKTRGRRICEERRGESGRREQWEMNIKQL